MAIKLRPGVYTKEVDLSHKVTDGFVTLTTSIYEPENENGIYINCPEEYKHAFKRFLSFHIEKFCDQNNLTLIENDILKIFTDFKGEEK